jgi:hypothetical protein
MSWSVEVQFSGKAPRGVGGGFPPRGLYQFTTTKTEVKSPEGKTIRGIYFEHTITACYAIGEDGKTFAQDASWVNKVIKTRCFFPDANSSEGANEARERDLKAALLAHGNGDRDSLAASTGRDVRQPQRLPAVRPASGWR